MLGLTTILDRWGNSLGVRLPKAVIESAGLREGDRVHIQVENGMVVIRAAKPRYSLDELLEGVTPGSMHAESATSGVIGAEDIW